MESGHLNEPGGNVPAREVAASECVFNGRNEPDESAPVDGDTDESALHAGDGEPAYYDGEQGEWVGDDGDWSSTPAGGNVQSGGQITAAGARLGDPGLIVPTGVQGQACNPTAEPFPEP